LNQTNALRINVKFPAHECTGHLQRRKGTTMASRPPSSSRFDTPTWHVQYRQDAWEHVLTRPTPELAIESACRLIDEGADVFGIGTGPLTDSIARDQIARIHAIWARPRAPFGRSAAQGTSALHVRQ
jgi:hypothetical protein